MDRPTRAQLESTVEDWVRLGCPSNGELVSDLLDHLRMVAKDGAKKRINGDKVHLFIENVMDGNA